MGSVSDEVIRELDLNYAEIGSLIGLFMVPGLFLAIPAGLAGKFFSDKALIGFGLIALSFGGLVAALAQGFWFLSCLLYTSPSPRDGLLSRMPSSA